MKKYLLITIVIALLAVAVFGGRATAFWWDWNEQFVTPTPTPTPSCPGVCMETLSDTFTVEDQDDMHVDYPGVRHVSLTLFVLEADDPGNYANLYMYFDNSRVNIAELESNKWITYEFDANKWQLGASNSDDVLPLEIRYRATITYPSDQ